MSSLAIAINFWGQVPENQIENSIEYSSGLTTTPDS